MSNEKIVHVSDNSYQREVLEARVPVLVDFWAVWCGPCKMIAPLVEELADDYAGKVKVCKLNVDENNRTASENGVMSIPTLIVYKNGQEVKRLVGFMPKAQIAETLDNLL